LVCQQDKLNSKQYHVGDKNGPDFSFGKDLISLFSTRVQVNPQKGRWWGLSVRHFI